MQQSDVTEQSISTSGDCIFSITYFKICFTIEQVAKVQNYTQSLQIIESRLYNCQLGLLKPNIFVRRRSRSRSFDHANAKWGKDDHHSKQRKEEENGKAKPNFALSGKLTEETNTYRGVVIKYR